MMGISVLANKFGSEDQVKKSFLAQKLKFRFGVHSYFFLLQRDFTHVLGGIGPEMHTSGTRLVTFFRSAIFTWGGYLSLRNAPRVAGRKMQLVAGPAAYLIVIVNTFYSPSCLGRKAQRREISIFESNSQFPTCLSHTMVASRCPFYC